MPGYLANLDSVSRRHHPVQRPPPVHPVQHGVQPEVFLGREVLVQCGLLEHHTDLAAHARLIASYVASCDPDFA